MSSGAAQVATITGPALGGLAYVIAPGWPYAIMLAFWLAGMLLTGAIEVAQTVPPKGAASADDVYAGVRFIRSNPAILGTISLDLFAVLFGGVVALLPIYARDILQAGPLGLGVLRAAPAVGALLMTMLLARHSISRRVGLRMFQAVIVFGVATVVFAVSHWMWLSAIALAVLGAADTVSVVIRFSLVQLAHARRDARPRRRGELSLHQRLQPARPVRERRHRRSVRHHAGRRARRRRHDRDCAALDEAVPDAARRRAAGVGGLACPGRGAA